MINFYSTSSILIVTSILTFAALFFIGLAAPEQGKIISFGYDTAFLALWVGFVLIKKNIQQLIGLFLYVIVYNLDLITEDLFKLSSNDFILHLANRYTFFILIASFILLFPTLFNKYKFRPLTSHANISDSTIIAAIIILTLLLQITLRLI